MRIVVRREVCWGVAKRIAFAQISMALGVVNILEEPYEQRNKAQNPIFVPTPP